MSPFPESAYRIDNILKRSFLALFPILLLFGCDKEEMKKPTRVGITFNVQTDEVDVDTGGRSRLTSGLSLSINSGKMYIKSIRIIGERAKGKDVDFVREERIEVPIQDGTTGEKTYFELPQGSYGSLRMELRLGKEGGSKVLECSGERKIDPPAGPLEATPFRLTCEEERTVKISVVQGSSLELKKGDPRTLQVQVKTGEWFRGIDKGLWQGAAVQKGPNGEDRIMLRKGKNPSIYQKVLERIEDGFKARVL